MTKCQLKACDTKDCNTCRHHYDEPGHPLDDEVTSAKHAGRGDFAFAA